jgi:hypothetical protein
MTAQEILTEIKPLGSESCRNVLFNHGIPEPCYGAKIEKLKKIQKRVKVDCRLALELYDTGVYDAQFSRVSVKAPVALARWSHGPLSCPPVSALTRTPDAGWTVEPGSIKVNAT